MQKTRDPQWDYLKGISIILIVLGHLYYFSNQAHCIVWDTCNSLQLPPFFFVSGLFLKKSLKKDLSISFISKRFIRLILPFVTFCTIWCICKPNLYPTIIYDEFKYGYWFTLILFEFIVSFWVLEKIHNYSKVPLIVIQILFYVVISLIKVFLYNDYATIISLNLFWHYYPFILIGYWGEYIVKICKIKTFALFSSLIYIVSLYLLHYKNIHIALTTAQIFGLLMLISATNQWLPFKTVFTFIGKQTLEIYLLHYFIIYNFAEYISQNNNSFLLFSMLFPLSFLISTICIVISKLLKQSNLLKKILFGT